MFKLFAGAVEENRKESLFIFRWFSASLIIHLVLAWFSQGFYHYDEHFQILEFAGYKMGFIPASSLAWEFGAHIRSAFQPFIAYLVLRILKVFSIDDPFLAATILRLFSALLGWLSMVCFTFAALPFFKSARIRKWLIMLSAVLAILIFLHARFSSESWSGSFAFMGIAILLALMRKTSQPASNYYTFWLLISGFLLGLSYLCRIQSLFLYPGLFLWLFFIAKITFKNLVIIGFGILAAVLMGLCLDRWFYGEWVNTTYQYYVQNIVEGKAAGFGTEPWWWYFKAMAISGFVPLQILAIILVFIAFLTNRKNLLVWVCIPFLIAHFLVSHKEFRFLFPLVDALPFLLMLGISEILNYPFVKRMRQGKTIFIANVMVIVFLVYNASSIIEMVMRPPCSYLYPIHYIYKECTGPTDVIINDRNLNGMLNGRLVMHYYQRHNTRYVYIQNLDSVKIYMAAHNNPIFLMTSVQGYGIGNDCAVISPFLEPAYYQLPEWLKNFNVNHWADRTGFWRIYRINPSILKSGK